MIHTGSYWSSVFADVISQSQFKEFAQKQENLSCMQVTEALGFLAGHQKHSNVS